VLDVPYRRSVELIRSRTGCDLDGAISASEFGIHGRYNQSNFADQVLIHDRSRIDARRPSRILHHDPVSQHRSVLRADAGKGDRLAAECALPGTGGRNEIVETAQYQELIENIVADGRQFTNLLLGQRLSDGRARS